LVKSKPVIDRMQAQIDAWRHSAEGRADAREAFLSCYQMMTTNMLAAIDRSEFNDGEWVYSLLQHFAEYYFDALAAYEHGLPSTPAVWKRAFEAAVQPGTAALQNLLLGVNAHINYDLIFTLTDMLEPDWSQLSLDERQGRYDDYTHVNAIIAQTIDAVQEQILAPGTEALAWIDRLSGPLDELVVANLLSGWREAVWERAMQLLDALPDEKPGLQEQFERDALQRARLILLTPRMTDASDSPGIPA
jgi:hypothetical protein